MGSTHVVLFDSLDEVYGGRGSSTNGGGGGSHGFIFSFFVVWIRRCGGTRGTEWLLGFATEKEKEEEA